MKIGIDASRANVENKTGTEWYSYWLIKEFCKIADPNDQYFLYTKEKLRSEYQNLPTNFHSQVLRWPPKFLWTQIRLSLRLAVKPVDVLFVPAHTLPLIKSKRTVLTVHDIGFERLHGLYSKEAIGGRRLGKKILSAGTRIFTRGRYGSSELDYHRWAMRTAITKATQIIVPSSFTKNEVIDVYGIPEKRIQVIYHGVDQNIYHPITDTSIIQNELDRLKITAPYFLYVGRLEKKKNTAGLIKAFSIYKNETKLPHVMILAGQPGYGFDEVRNEILKSNLASAIIMPGYLQPESLVALLNKATAFVFPSFYEGFGLPLLEAMACGSPVVASRAASIPEVAGDAAELFETERPDELAAILKRLATDQDYRHNLQQRGFSRIHHFRWDECAKKTLAVITGTS